MLLICSEIYYIGLYRPIHVYGTSKLIFLGCGYLIKLVIDLNRIISRGTKTLLSIYTVALSFLSLVPLPKRLKMVQTVDMWDIIWYALVTFIGFGLFLVISKVIGFFRERERYRDLVKDFAGPPPHWLLGNIPILPHGIEGLEVGVQLTKKYGSIYPLWFGNRAGLQCNHPDVLRSILNSSEPKDPLVYAFVVPWIGDGLLVSKVSNNSGLYFTCT